MLAALAAAVAFAAADPATGTLLVLNKAEANVSLIDLAAGKEVARVATGVGPHEVAVTPDGRFALVADYGDEKAAGSTLTLLDVAAAKVVKTIDLSPHRRPHGLAFLGEELRAVVTSETSGALLVVDVEKGKVEQAIPTGQKLSHMVAVTADLKLAAVANIGSGSTTLIDLVTEKSGAVVATGAGAEGIDFAPDGKSLWVADRAADQVSVVDPKKGEVVATLACASFPIRVKVTPDSRRALVSCAKSGDLAIFDVAERKELKRVKTSVAPPGADHSTLGPDFAGSAAPIGILIHPDGHRAYVAHANVDAIAVLDLDRLEFVGTLTAGKAPDGLGWSPLAVVPPKAK